MSTSIQTSATTTHDAAALIEDARRFGRERVRDAVLDWESAGRLPQSFISAAVQRDLLRIQVPREHGGLGHRYSVKMRVAEALSEASMPVAFSVVNLHNVIAKLAVDAPPSVASEFVPTMLSGERFGATALSEPGAGSDFSAIATQATRDGEGWRLNGEKGWITNAAFADVFVMYAQTDASKGGRGIACFLIDAQRDGFVRAAPERLFGANVIGTGGFKLNDYYAPAEHLLHPAGEAFKKALNSINGARTYVAAMCCGMVDDALAQAIAYGKSRHAFGRPLLSNQGLRWALSDVATDLEAARLLTYRAAELVDDGAPDAILAASHAKKYAAQMAERSLPVCIQGLGANGLRAANRLGHQLAGAKIAHYVDGSTEIQNERIAALLLD
ncbi:MAG: acyl-CoA dehydrogenase family protein [Pseudomonadota bacterium]